MLSQMASREERETHINVDYYKGEVVLYTNVVAVMRRLEKKGITHSSEEKIGGQAFSRTYVLPISEISKIANKSLFYLSPIDSENFLSE